jgi:hypothetical protein
MVVDADFQSAGAAPVAGGAADNAVVAEQHAHPVEVGVLFYFFYQLI